MDPFWSDGALSPSGSRAQANDPWDALQEFFPSPEANVFGVQDEFDAVHTASENMDYQEDMAMVSSSLGMELAPGQIMSTKIPPEWNGRGSWFAYEELVFDWQDVCVLEKEKQGPALRNRLRDDAIVYKQTLDRDRLKTADGVEYFLKTMRPNFVKGVQNVFYIDCCSL